MIIIKLQRKVRGWDFWKSLWVTVTVALLAMAVVMPTRGATLCPNNHIHSSPEGQCPHCGEVASTTQYGAVSPMEIEAQFVPTLENQVSDSLYHKCLSYSNLGRGQKASWKVGAVGVQALSDGEYPFIPILLALSNLQHLKDKARGNDTDPVTIFNNLIDSLRQDQIPDLIVEYNGSESLELKEVGEKLSIPLMDAAIGMQEQWLKIVRIKKQNTPLVIYKGKDKSKFWVIIGALSVEFSFSDVLGLLTHLSDSSSGRPLSMGRGFRGRAQKRDEKVISVQLPLPPSYSSNTHPIEAGWGSCTKVVEGFSAYRECLR